MKITYFRLLSFCCFCLVAAACNNQEDPQPVDETIMVTVTNFSDASSCGTSDGSLTAAATRENGDTFTYSVDGKNYQPTGAFANLSPGEYTVTAKDENGNIIYERNADGTIKMWATRNHYYVGATRARTLLYLMCYDIPELLNFNTNSNQNQVNLFDDDLPF